MFLCIKSASDKFQGGYQKPTSWYFQKLHYTLQPQNEWIYASLCMLEYTRMQLSVVALTKLPVELKVYFLLKVAVCVLWIFKTMGLVRGSLSEAPVHRYGDLYFVSENQ